MKEFVEALREFEENINQENKNISSTAKALAIITLKEKIERGNNYNYIVNIYPDSCRESVKRYPCGSTKRCTGTIGCSYAHFGQCH